MASTASIIRPFRPSSRSAISTMSRFGVRRWRACADQLRDLALRSLSVAVAGDDEGGRRRAADAGIAMDDERRGTIPASHELQHRLDVGVGRQDVSVLGEHDVGHGNEHMPAFRDLRRPDHFGALVDQRDHRARAAGADGLRDLRQSAHVNRRHGFPRSGRLGVTRGRGFQAIRRTARSSARSSHRKRSAARAGGQGSQGVPP